MVPAFDWRVKKNSKKNKNSVDIVLGLNGLPVATLELKNQFTGQNVNHAKKQYKDTRDPKELLFSFKILSCTTPILFPLNWIVEPGTNP